MNTPDTTALAQLKGLLEYEAAQFTAETLVDALNAASYDPWNAYCLLQRWLEWNLGSFTQYLEMLVKWKRLPSWLNS